MSTAPGKRSVTEKPTMDEKRVRFDKVVALVFAQRKGPTGSKVDLYDQIRAILDGTEE